MRSILLAVAIALAALVPLTAGASAQAAPTVQATTDATLGPILTDGAGRTLYRYTPDPPDASTCDGGCAQAWPPLLLPEGDPVLAPDLPGTLGVITRSDGSRQVTYNGMPLYYFVSDTGPGMTTGQGVGGIWFVVAPVAPADATPAATS